MNQRKAKRDPYRYHASWSEGAARNSPNTTRGVYRQLKRNHRQQA